MDMNNIVTAEVGNKQLERLAEALRQAVKQDNETRDQVLENWLLEGELLLEARQHFPSDTLFGGWLASNGVKVEKNKRLALMAFAGDPERARLVFSQTVSQSAQLIYNQNFRIPS